MAVLRSVDATPAERTAYLKHAAAMRAAVNGEDADTAPVVEDEDDATASELVSLSVERIAELGGAEQYILTVSSEGFGKRTSAYDYRRTGRGGQGLMAHDISKRGGRLVASFPVEDTDELLLVSDQGQLIRVKVGQIRTAGRNTQGVTIFRTGENEHVVSVERLEGEAEADASDADDDAAEGVPETE
jgi:DNA gyrase subunit A